MIAVAINYVSHGSSDVGHSQLSRLTPGPEVLHSSVEGEKRSERAVEGMLNGEEELLTTADKQVNMQKKKRKH